MKSIKGQIDMAHKLHQIILHLNIANKSVDPLKYYAKGFC